MNTISKIINKLDKMDESIEEMHQIPSEKINLVRMKINELVELLDDLSNEYGDEDISEDYDENDYDEDVEIDY